MEQNLIFQFPNGIVSVKSFAERKTKFGRGDTCSIDVLNGKIVEFHGSSGSSASSEWFLRTIKNNKNGEVLFTCHKFTLPQLAKLVGNFNLFRTADYEEKGNILYVPLCSDMRWFEEGVYIDENVHIFEGIKLLPEEREVFYEESALVELINGTKSNVDKKLFVFRDQKYDMEKLTQEIASFLGCAIISLRGRFSTGCFGSIRQPATLFFSTVRGYTGFLQGSSWTITEVSEKEEAERRWVTCKSWEELKILADYNRYDDIAVMDIKLKELDERCHENLAFSFLCYKAKYENNKFMAVSNEFKYVEDLQVFRRNHTHFNCIEDLQLFITSRFVCTLGNKINECRVSEHLHVAPVMKEPFVFSLMDDNKKRRKVALYSFVEIAAFIQEQSSNCKKINSKVLEKLRTFILSCSQSINKQ
jgi:hypothetical protein